VAILQGVLGGAEALGSSVALDGEVAVVGSPADNTVAMAAGRVLVYQRSPAAAALGAHRHAQASDARRAIASAPRWRCRA